MSETVMASNGVMLPVNDLPLTIGYVEVGDPAVTFVQTFTVSYQGTTYIQTFTNNGAQITGWSRWVAQS